MHLSLCPCSPLWKMANRQWFYFPCRSPAWTRAWWFPTVMGGPSAPAAKSPGKAAVRRLNREGEGPGRWRKPRRRRSVVPSASASPLTPTPSTSTPELCSLSLSQWWMWSTGWRTPCEKEAAGLKEWLPSRAVYKKLLSVPLAGRLLQLIRQALLNNSKKKLLKKCEYGNKVIDESSYEFMNWTSYL